MNTNTPRHCGIFSSLCPAGYGTTVSPAIIQSVLFLLIVVVSATGCDESQIARHSTSGSSSGVGISTDERLGAPPSDIRFEVPIRILAGENPVSVDDPGYACPTIADLDGDGADDLVVGQFANGQMTFYRNENQPGQTPKFAQGAWIKTGDDVAEVPGVW